ASIDLTQTSDGRSSGKLVRHIKSENIVMPADHAPRHRKSQADVAAYREGRLEDERQMNAPFRDGSGTIGDCLPHRYSRAAQWSRKNDRRTGVSKPWASPSWC